MTFDPEYRSMVRIIVDDLLAVDEGLSEWEVQFIEDVSKQLDRCLRLSENQLRKLDELHKEHCE